MRRIGTVVRTVGRLAVVRCPDDAPPAIGVPALDETLDVVGRVVDVFGPVSQPYLLVAPSTRDSETLLNQRLYSR